MNALENPALEAFLDASRKGLVFAQILIRSDWPKFEICHAQDRETPLENLRSLAESEIRETARFTAEGAFRPLKSAPNLRGGWRFETTAPESFGLALDALYPGALADWFAVNFRHARPTHYREFTHRQSGMYRLTAKLTDEQAAPVIRACCHEKFCLKQRLWTVNGLPSDAAREKSLIPCLEPCAILLEFARKAARLEQQPEATDAPANLTEDAKEIREADFENPNNPRRLQWGIEKKFSARGK